MRNIFGAIALAVCPTASLADACPTEQLRSLGPLLLGSTVYDPVLGWALEKADVETQGEAMTETAFLFALIDKKITEIGGTLILVVPPKRGIYAPDATHDAARVIFAGESQAELLDAYQDLVVELRRTGVIVPNLHDAFSSLDQPYFKTDHHWRPQAAYATAMAIWDELADRGVLRLADTARGYWPSDTVIEQLSGSHAKDVNAVCDDLVAQEEYVYPLVALNEQSGSDLSQSLFGAAPVAEFAVTLLGTSFSSVQTGLQFDAALNFWLQAPVENLALSAGNTTSAFEMLRTTPGALNADLIIWEIAPNQFPRDSDNIRQVTATVLGACEGSAPSARFEAIGQEWSAWQALGGDSPILRLETSVEAIGNMLVEFSYGEETRQFTIEKRSAIPVDRRDTVWATYAAIEGEDEGLIHPDGVRIMPPEADETYSFRLSNCDET